MSTTIFGFTVEDIRHMYVVDKQSWDEIAVKCGKARSSTIKAVKRIIGEDTYTHWQNERKGNVSELPKKEPIKQEVKTAKPEKIKYIAQANEQGILYTMYAGTEKLVYQATTMVESKYILGLIEEKDVEGIKKYIRPMTKLEELGITYDEAEKTFNLKGIKLNTKFHNLILKGYEELKQGKNDTVVGLTNMIHNLNKANRLDKLDQLYEFLKHNDIKILSNGFFVGYKYVSQLEDNVYVDSFSKTIEQNKGDYVYTHENGVNPDPKQVCSNGLHVGSWDYVQYNAFIAQVVVNPLDVVSVPNDYNGSKLRCKGYYILDIMHKPRTYKAFNPVDVNKLNLTAFNNVYVESTGATFKGD